MVPRRLYMRVWTDLATEKRMIFMAGPRQGGRTTLAQQIARSFTNHVYFNWDVPQQPVQLIENPAFFE